MQKVKVIKGSCGQVMQFLGMLWYRYFRLTPPYLLAIVVSSLTMKWYYYNRVFDWYTYDRSANLQKVLVAKYLVHKHVFPAGRTGKCSK